MKLKKMLTIDNAKTTKGESLGYLTGILYLSPAKMSGYNVCGETFTAGCENACLNTAGRGAMSPVQLARLNKTLLFFQNRPYFFESLIDSIKALERKALREKKIPTVRLNGTSDLPWETIKYKGKNIFDMFPHIQFYDYTANLKRSAISKKISNYHLTFSRKETRQNNRDCEIALKLGLNVAVVYRDNEKAIKNLKAIDGDLHDLRFLDGYQGKIIALKAKGKAKKDQSGFVVLN